MANNTTKANQAPDLEVKSDRVAAALAKAQAFVEGSHDLMGTILGLSDDCTASWFVPAEVGQGQADALRRDLSARGYELAPQASISGVGNAEVWEVPNEVAALLDAARTKRNRMAMGLTPIS